MNEIEKEISRIQLLSARYKDKLRMCPLEIKREEIRAFYINSYIKDLRRQLEEKDNVIDEATKLANDIFYSGWDYEEKDDICIKLLEILERGKNENSNN